VLVWFFPNVIWLFPNVIQPRNSPEAVVMRKSLLALSLSVAIVAVTLVVGAQAQTVSFSGASRTIATLSPGCCTPNEVAVDGSGDVFFAYGTEVEEILAVNGVVPASPTIKTVGSGFGVLWGLAVDKSGNVFVTDYEDAQTATTSGVKEITAASGYTSVVLLGGGYSFTFATAITVDGNGNVFVLDGEGNPAVREILAAGGYSTVTTLLASSEISHEPGTIAVDSSGNIYVIAAAGNDGVEEIHAVDGSIPASPTVTMFGSGIIDATSVAVDWNGNLYISDSVELSGVYENAVQEFLAADNYSTVKTVGSGNSFSDGFSGALFGIAVDASGDIFAPGFYFDTVSELSASGGTFSSTNVGSTSSSPTTLAFTFSSSAEVGSIAILTEGATGLDFTNAGTGTCTVGTTYAAGANCGVDVSFSPLAPGARYGAVELTDGSGNVLATGYVQGTGVAPQVSFLPGTQSVIASAASSDLNYPGNAAVDASGKVYIPDLGLGEVLLETPSSGSYTQSVLPFSGLTAPDGVAVDGAGNVYITDNANNTLIKESLSGGSYTQSTITSSLNSPDGGIAVDGSGNIYLSDTFNHQVL
jgi:sugar lactone lactonase YvrE